MFLPDVFVLEPRTPPSQVVALFLPRRQLHRFGFAYCHKGICDWATRYWEPGLRDSPP